jgi:hypothetical protein
MNKLNTLCAALLLTSGLHATDSMSADKIAVTEDNYETAESDFSFNGVLAVIGTNKWMFEKGLTSIDKQKVVRQNRDTIYSWTSIKW